MKHTDMIRNAQLRLSADRKSQVPVCECTLHVATKVNRNTIPLFAKHCKLDLTVTNMQEYTYVPYMTTNIYEPYLCLFLSQLIHIVLVAASLPQLVVHVHCSCCSLE